MADAARSASSDVTRIELHLAGSGATWLRRVVTPDARKAIRL
jgi:hypothetical protein